MILNSALLIVLSISDLAKSQNLISTEIHTTENYETVPLINTTDIVENWYKINKDEGLKSEDIATARKKRKGGGSNVNNIKIVTDHEDQSEQDSYEFIQSKGKRRKKRGKKTKGYKKYVKTFTPIGLFILGFKILIQHMIIKKLAAITLGSLLLSKMSFVLSTLLALKQLFYTGHHEKSDTGDKLEVVHIPIRKKLPEFQDRQNDKNNKYIPVSHVNDDFEQATPIYYDYYNNPYKSYNEETIMKK